MGRNKKGKGKSKGVSAPLSSVQAHFEQQTNEKAQLVTEAELTYADLTEERDDSFVDLANMELIERQRIEQKASSEAAAEMTREFQLKAQQIIADEIHPRHQAEREHIRERQSMFSEFQRTPQARAQQFRDLQKERAELAKQGRAKGADSTLSNFFKKAAAKPAQRHADPTAAPSLNP